MTSTDAPRRNTPAPTRARQIGRRIGSVLLSALAIVAAIAVGAAVFFLALYLHLAVAIIAGAVTVFLVAWLLTALAHRTWRSPRTGPRRTLVRRKAPFIVAGALLTLTGVAAGSTILAPVPDGPSVATGRPTARFWDLSTGSRVAYWKLEARGAVTDATPVVFVHGGPGGYVSKETFPLLRGLRASGHDVYVYDQPGAGLSSDLKMSDYTTERQVADLDAIRGKIGSPTLDLVGHSAGGYVVEAYTAAHPDRVAKVAIMSPGGYNPAPSAEAASQREWDAIYRKAPKDLEVIEKNSPHFGEFPARLAVATLLFQVGARTPAENLVSQEEGRRMMYQVLAPLNVFANLALVQDFKQTWRSTLRGLKSAGVPTLYVRSEHDYVTWAEQRPYARANADLTTVYIADAPHSSWDKQPRTTVRALSAFLNAEPQPAGIYLGDTNPLLAGAEGAHD